MRLQANLLPRADGPGEREKSVAGVLRGVLEIYCIVFRPTDAHKNAVEPLWPACRMIDMPIPRSEIPNGVLA